MKICMKRNITLKVIGGYIRLRTFMLKQGRRRPLDTPKIMIERRERERKVEGEI